MEEDEVGAGFFELVEALGDLFGGTDEAGAEAAIRDGVVFERDALLELRAGEPLLVIRIASGRLLNVRDAANFVLSFFFGFANDSVTRDAEFQRDGIVLFSALAKVSDFFRDAFGRVAVHEVSVAFGGDEFFGSGGFATGVERWTRFGNGFWLKDVVFDAVILSGE